MQSVINYMIRLTGIAGVYHNQRDLPFKLRKYGIKGIWKTDGKTYQVEHYNLEMIISVGYRVKSNRGVEFRKWANKVLKQYIIQGYAINEKRLEALQRTISIQTKMLAASLDVEEIDVLKKKKGKLREF